MNLHITPSFNIDRLCKTASVLLFLVRFTFDKKKNRNQTVTYQFSFIILSKWIGKKILACSLFSSKLAHATQSECFITHLFRIYAIYFFFISMPTPAMGSVISKISNRLYFVSFGTMFLKCFPTCRTHMSRKMFLSKISGL